MVVEVVLTRTPSSPRDRQRGMALVLMALVGFLAMAVWMLAWRATHDAIRVERVIVQRDLRARSTLKALALAADLLRTGPPPGDPYSCIFALDDGEDGELFVTATYQRDGTDFDYDVSTQDSSSTDLATLPLAPPSF